VFPRGVSVGGYAASQRRTPWSLSRSGAGRLCSSAKPRPSALWYSNIRSKRSV